MLWLNELPCIRMSIQRREQRLQDQLSNPHYLKPSTFSSKSTPGRSGESLGFSESSGLTASVDTSRIPVQKLELGIGLVIGRSCDSPLIGHVTSRLLI